MKSCTLWARSSFGDNHCAGAFTLNCTEWVCSRRSPRTTSATVAFTVAATSSPFPLYDMTNSTCKRMRKHSSDNDTSWFFLFFLCSCHEIKIPVVLMHNVMAWLNDWLSTWWQRAACLLFRDSGDRVYMPFSFSLFCLVCLCLGIFYIAKSEFEIKTEFLSNITFFTTLRQESLCCVGSGQSDNGVTGI